MDFLKLQNGSDIRGVALEKNGVTPNLTDDAAKSIGAAFARWLADKLNKEAGALRVAIGRDSRVTGEKLACSLGAGLACAGAEAIDMALATTPAMFMSTVMKGFEFDGAVMVTASHLPMERNGFKFFTASGGLDKKDITKILTLASELKAPGGISELKRGDIMSAYSKRLVSLIRADAGMGDTPLNGLRVIVDAGNGAGGFFASEVLSPLGADTTGSLYLEPDGAFPNHAPNPEDETAMQSITAAVKRAKADLGIIFDTDVDRAGAVLSDGKELNRNRLIAMIAAIELRDHPHTAIVTDSITSTGLNEFITAKGGVHHRFKRGYRNVINESVRLNEDGVDSQIAMETSGHGALKENFFLDDGAYLMVKLLVELASSASRGEALGDMIRELREPFESREFRMTLKCEDFAAYGKAVLESVASAVETANDMQRADPDFEGVRASLDKDGGDGWFLLRMSLHDPLMPLNIESDSPGGAKKIAKRLVRLLASFDMLDTDELVKFAKE